MIQEIRNSNASTDIKDLFPAAEKRSVQFSVEFINRARLPLGSQDGQRATNSRKQLLLSRSGAVRTLASSRRAGRACPIWLSASCRRDSAKLSMAQVNSPESAEMISAVVNRNIRPGVVESSRVDHHREKAQRIRGKHSERAREGSDLSRAA